MKRIVVIGLLLCGIGMAATTWAQVAKPLRVGVEGGYAPFSWKLADGSFQGFDIDIANAICARLKVKCVLVEIGFDSMIPSLTARKIDLIAASMAITKERKKAVNFSDMYFDGQSRMVARSDAKFEVTTEGMNGKRIGVQRGTIQDNFIGIAFGKSRITRYAKLDEIYVDLANGRLEAVLDDTVSANEGFLKLPSGKGFAFIGPVFRDPKYFGDGVGIAMRKADTELLAKVNKAIAEIRRNGEFKKIQDKYFDFEIFPN